MRTTARCRRSARTNCNGVSAADGRAAHAGQHDLARVAVRVGQRHGLGRRPGRCELVWEGVNVSEHVVAIQRSEAGAIIEIEIEAHRSTCSNR